MEGKFDREKFERLLADKRHKQLASLLESIADKLNNGETDKSITDAIEKEIAALGDFAEAIKQLPAPEVNVDLTPLEKAAQDNLIKQKEVIEKLQDLISLEHQKVVIENLVKGVPTPIDATNPLPVTGSFFPYLQNVSVAELPLPAGAATAAGQQNDALTNAELRATPVPVSGSLIITPSGTQDVNIVSSIELEVKNDAGNPIPISAAALPLPTGAATSAKQDLLLAELQLKADLTETQPVSAASLPLPTGSATSALQTSGNSSLSSIDTKLPSGLTVTANRLQVELPSGGGGLTNTELRATPVPVSGTVTATPTGTQNVDVTANTIGLSTGAKQDTGNTSLSSIDTKTPALGQALAAASTPVVLTAAQITTLTPPAAITGFNLEATQLLVKAKTDNLDVLLSTRLKPADTLAGVTTVAAVTTITNAVTIKADTPANQTNALKVDGSAVTQPVSLASVPSHPVTNAGTFATQATLQAGTAVVGKVGIDQTTDGTTNAVRLLAETTKVIGTVNVAAGQTIAVTNTGTFATQAAATLSAETTKVIGTVNPPPITKGTQGTTGFTTQDLKDAGRNTTNYFMAAPIITTVAEVMMSLTGYKSGAAVTATATPAVVTAGKTYRIQTITFSYFNVAALGSARFTVRINTGGVAVIGSPLSISRQVGISGDGASTAGHVTTLVVEFPDGMELAAGSGIAVGMQGFGVVPTTGTIVGYGKVEITGYEY